jgi:hypothetical protein
LAAASGWLVIGIFVFYQYSVKKKEAPWAIAATLGMPVTMPALKTPAAAASSTAQISHCPVEFKGLYTGAGFHILVVG